MIYELIANILSDVNVRRKIVVLEKSIGDWIEKGETVFVMESDKADMDIESFYSGYLASIIVPAGNSVSPNQTVGFIAETKAEIPEAQERAKHYFK